MQTTLLGLAIAFILALIAALIGPYLIDWNQFRPQFEAEATRVIGAPVRVGGKLDARLLPTPSFSLRSVAVGGANDLGKVGADKLDVEFSLGSLMRGEWRANELTINGLSLDLGLDSQGRVDWPVSTGTFSLGSLSIDRLNLTGRVALHDAASRGTLELNDVAFSGDVRGLASSVRGDGNFTLAGTRYPFRVSSGQSADGAGTRLHFNLDPGKRSLSADLDGVLTFAAQSPRFEGALTLASAAASKQAGDKGAAVPWRVSSRIKANPASAQLEQVEVSYGLDERALKASGVGDISFGASPLLHAVLTAKQLDADRFAARDDNATEPIRLLPGLRALMKAIPETPVPAHIEFSSEQIMLGGRPLQNLAADLRGDGKSLRIDRLDFRAPGSTRVDLSGANARAGPSAGITAALDIDSSDPDTLVAWLQGRNEVAYRNQKPLRVRGDVSIGPDHVAVERMKADVDGGAVEGRVVVSTLLSGGSRIVAEMKADRLDLDAATVLVRSLAGPQAEWPEEAQLSLDIGRALSGGQELRPLTAKLGYGPTTISLDELKIGQPERVTVEGSGNLDRAHATGRLALHASAISLGQLTGLIAPLAPALAARLNSAGTAPGPARLNLKLFLDENKAQADRGNVRAVLDLDAPPLKGGMTITSRPSIAAIRGLDLDALQKSEVNIESSISSAQAGGLLALLGLDRTVAAGEGPAQFEGSVTGSSRSPLRLNAKLSATGLDAEAQGTAEPWAAEPHADVNLKVRSADLTPLFGLKPSDALAKNISLSSHLALKRNQLTFDDLDSGVSGSRLRGHLAVTLGDQRNIDGEVGLDTIDLGPAFELAIGAAGHDAAEPLSTGSLPGSSKGWRGRIAFQALRGSLPGGAELRPVSGAVKSDGQSLTFEAIKGKIGGSDVSADIDAKQGADGIALNARVQFAGVDGSALHYRALAMPTGRVSMQMSLSSQGRSASALTGALSGSGIVTLESARIAGLDPGVFDAAVRASDEGRATDDTKLRQVIEPVLSHGALPVASAQIPFSIRDGRIRVAATTLEAKGVQAIVSGGYDISADQADIRASLAPTSATPVAGRPDIQLFAVGSPDALDRTIDVAALSSWLAVRAIDRETRRLDSIERGDPPPITPASIPTPTPTLPPSSVPTVAPSAVLPDAPAGQPAPGQRRVAPKAKAAAPRPPLPAPGAPVVSQQVAPLPPPIEVRPAPGAPRPQKPRQPLVLAPTAKPPQPAF